MATHADDGGLNVQEQIVRIKKMQADLDKTFDNIVRTQAETKKVSAETEFMPRAIIFQAMLATAALLGAGAAIAKLFFP